MNTPILMSVWGSAKTGKSHFALTAPEPIYYFNLDFGVRPLLHKFADKDITVYDVPVVLFAGMDESDDHIKGLTATLNTFQNAYQRALNELRGTGGSVVIDTTSILWKLIQEVYVGGSDKEGARPKRFNFNKANMVMDSYLRAPLHVGINGVMLMQCKGVFDSRGQETGEVQPQGYGGTTSVTEVTLQMLKTDSNSRVARIQDCRPNIELEGLELEYPTWEALYDMFYGGTE